MVKIEHTCAVVRLLAVVLDETALVVVLRAVVHVVDDFGTGLFSHSTESIQRPPDGCVTLLLKKQLPVFWWNSPTIHLVSEEQALAHSWKHDARIAL